MMFDLPDTILNEEQLDELLSKPPDSVIKLMSSLEGDLMILGIGGKMGSTLGRMAARANEISGNSGKIMGVSRFSDPKVRANLENYGIETIPCDLLNLEDVEKLPLAKNIIYMAGKKFGTGNYQPGTWASNVSIPNHVATHFRNSRIVVFSTGCVYPLVTAANGGSVESDPPSPVGEYAQSCLGRERVFEYWSDLYNTPICLFRLNYAVDLRYGVLHDIGMKVFMGHPVDVSASHFNVIWQGDACAQALRCLELCASPAAVLNITGPEILSVHDTALQFGQFFNKDVKFSGTESESRMYLSNASKAASLFGYPMVPALKMIHWQANWIASGGRSLDKPTHFEVTDGKF